MGALAARELTMAARTGSIPLAAFVVLALSTAFVLAWAPGVPVLAPMNFYEQARGLNWWLLAAVLPWTAVRSSPMDRGEAIVLMAALAGVGHTSAIVAKVVASAAVQSTVILAAVPALVLAQQSAAVSLTNVLIDLLAAVGLALLIAPLATASMLVAVDRLRAWFGVCGVGAAILLMAVIFGRDRANVGFLCAVAGAISVVCLCSIATSLMKTNPGGSDDVS